MKTMNLLQKVYNTIKEKIEFVFFKRKFNNWYETEDILIIEKIKRNEERIFKCLAEEDFNNAFYYYKISQDDALNDKKHLEDFKKYVLNDENNEH